MSVVENVRTRPKTLEPRMDDRFEQLERNARIRHDEVMNALRHLALSLRVARLESRESAH